MSTEHLVWAIDIYTNRSTSQEYPDLGVYSDSGMAVLRYSEADISSLATDTYNDLLLLECGTIKQSIDIRNGGGIAQRNGLSITLDNTDSLARKLESLGIILNACDVKITEYDFELSTSQVIFEGTIYNYRWDDVNLQIDTNVTFTEKRKVDLYNDTPVTFGQSDPDNSRYFKLIRTTNIEETLAVEDIAELAGYTGDYYPPDMKLFPVYLFYDSSNSIWVRLGFFNPSLHGTEWEQVFLNKFIKFIEGKSGNNGLYRKIIEVARSTATDNEEYFVFTLRDYTLDDILGNWEGTAEDQTWVQVVDIDKVFSADVLDCDGFYVNGVKQTLNPEIYAKADEEVIKVPPFSANISIVGNNQIDIDLLHFKDSPSNINSFIILPVESIELYSAADLSMWNSAGDTRWGDYKLFKYVDVDSLDPENPDYIDVPGIYYPGEGSLLPLLNWQFLNPENAIDKKNDTYCLLSYRPQDNDAVSLDSIKAVKIKLPARLQNFSKAYLVCKITENYGSQPQWWNKKVQILRRGYINRVHNVTEEIVLKTQESSQVSTVDCIPDFYYNPQTSTANKNFFRNSIPDGNSEYDLYSGYTRFLLADNPTDYDEIEEVLIAFKRSAMLSANADDETKIYQVAVIFETTAKVEEEIYV